jgi:tetratricopeptide (TPR) repeat protein
MADGGRLEWARLLYERAVFGGEAEAIPTAERELDALEADLALARGRIMHARFLAEHEENPRELGEFQRAAELFRRLGDVRGEAESQFWIGAYHQVLHGDSRTAVPFLERSYQLAALAGDKLTLSYAVRHLGFAEMAAGRLGTARERFEESVRLRRQVGFLPGVAAGLLALAELTAIEGTREQVIALLDEAAGIAERSGARGILRWIDQVRAETAAGPG